MLFLLALMVVVFCVFGTMEPLPVFGIWFAAVVGGGVALHLVRLVAQ
jgi:hypothetical protein